MGNGVHHRIVKIDRISLSGAVAMGVDAMIGAGILALTGQIAQLAGPMFPIVLIVSAIVTSFSAYSYIKMSDAWPSSGGIVIILKSAYGPGAIAASSLPMNRRLWSNATRSNDILNLFRKNCSWIGFCHDPEQLLVLRVS